MKYRGVMTPDDSLRYGGTCCPYMIPVAPYIPPRPGSIPLCVEGTVGLFTSIPGFCFFHLVRLFWNHIFTCVSVKLRDRARFSLSHTERYLVVLNLFSRATNCSYVNAVRARRGFPADLPESDEEPFLLARSLSSSSSSMTSSIVLSPSSLSFLSLIDKSRGSSGKVENKSLIRIGNSNYECYLYLGN